MNKLNKSYRWLIVALQVLLLSLLTSGAVLAQSDPEEIVVSPQRVETEADVKAYWTEERMRAAKLRKMKLEGIEPTPVQQNEEDSGKELYVVPADMAVVTDDIANTPTQDIESASLEPMAGTYPYAFTAYNAFPDVAPLYTFYPYRVVGKSFFTIPGVGDFVCSASVVNTPNYSSLITAGHCVYDPDTAQFAINVLFAPARYNGSNLYGTWTYNSLVTLVAWQNGIHEYDIGGIYLNRGGPPPGNFGVGQLGALGFIANADRGQNWHSHGYAAGAPFDGEHQHICAATWAVSDQPDCVPGDCPETMGIGCDSTGGSSGGPWIFDENGTQGVGNLINGVNSYGYVGIPDVMFSPYFGDGAIAIYDWLASQPIP